MINTWFLIMFLPFVHTTSIPLGYVEETDRLEIQFGAEWVIADVVFVEGSVVIPTQINSLVNRSCTPLSLQSDFKAGLRYSYFEIGFMHSCEHQVLGSRPYTDPYDHSFETLYLSFDTRRGK